MSRTHTSPSSGPLPNHWPRSRGDLSLALGATLMAAARPEQPAPAHDPRLDEHISLEPAQTRTVSFTLRADDLAFYDRQMRRVVEPGFFTVWVGTSSADERQRARFEVIGEVHQVER